jgi:hypothetical protein
MSEHTPIYEELLDGPFPCTLTSLEGSGAPYGVIVWCERRGEAVGVNAAEGVWLHNLRRDPRVGLVIVDTRNILRHVSITGRVASIEPDEDYEQLNSMSEVYEGRPYAYTTPDSVARYRIEIEVLKVRTLDLAPPPAP